MQCTKADPQNEQNAGCRPGMALQNGGEVACEGAHQVALPDSCEGAWHAVGPKERDKACPAE